MSRYIYADALKYYGNHIGDEYEDYFHETQWVYRSQIDNAPSIDICLCKDCKHRPVKEDVDGDNYGFNLIEPTEDDDRCPCLVDDGWYSWMPEDDFYCGYGEREGE